MHTSSVHLGTCVCAPGTHRYFMYRLTHLGTHLHIDIHWFILVKHSPELFWKESSRTSTVTSCYFQAVFHPLCLWCGTRQCYSKGKVKEKLCWILASGLLPCNGKRAQNRALFAVLSFLEA